MIFTKQILKSILCVVLFWAIAICLLEAKVSVSVGGYGFFGNRYLKRTLQVLDPIDVGLEALSSAYVEDTIWVLTSELKNKGYPKPKFKILFMLRDQILYQGVWDGKFSPELPHEIYGDKLKIWVDAGLLHYYEHIEVDEIEGFSRDDVLSYFYPKSTLYVYKTDRYYTPKRLRKSVQAFEEALRLRGYHEAVVTVLSEDVSSKGPVNVRLGVKLGPLFYVDLMYVYMANTKDPLMLPLKFPGIPVDDELAWGGYAQAFKYKEVVYQEEWVTHVRHILTEFYLNRGYPEVAVDIRKVAEEQVSGGRINVTLQTHISPKEQVRVAGVEWVHAQATQVEALGADELRKGDLLNLLTVQKQRDKLYRLNVFESIDVRYDKVTPQAWKVRYITRPEKKYKVNVLAGYGSYEQLRAGVELERRNLFGLAHSLEARAIQSLKATHGNLKYVIPTFRGNSLKRFAMTRFLKREEISFDRQEWVNSLGVDYLWEGPKINVSTRYNFEVLKIIGSNIPETVGRLDTKVSSIEVGLQHNRVDNPIFPQKGYQLFAKGEFAFSFLGGTVNYERFEMGGAIHYPLQKSLILHARISNGWLVTPENKAKNLPINKRFFPGGAHSIRGFREGQASPVDARGERVGAETYLLYTLELEQKMLSSISLIAFFDGLGIAQRVQNLPTDQSLYSVGFGASVDTLVGPLRAEYGYNVKRRAQDPLGAFHIGVGFPF